MKKILELAVALAILIFVSGAYGADEDFVSVGPHGWCDYITDGTADEVQINQAIQYCKNTAGVKSVFLAGPSYSLSGTVTIDTAIEFYGSSMGTVTITRNSGTAIEVTANDCNLHGFTSGSTGGVGCGIKTIDASNTLITDVRVYGFDTGVNIHGGVCNELHHLSVSDCVIDGILLDGDTTEAVINYASIWGGDTTFAGLHLRHASGSFITNVDVMVCEIGLLIDPAAGEVCHWNMFTQCDFDSCTSGQATGVFISSNGGPVRGVFMNMPWIASNGRGILISSNVDGVYLNDPTIFVNANIGIHVMGNASNVKIHGGMLGVNSARATTTQAFVDTTGYVEFSDVQIGKQLMLGPSTPTWHLVFTGNVLDALVSGCHFSDSGSSGKVSDSSGGRVAFIGNNGYP